MSRKTNQVIITQKFMALLELLQRYKYLRSSFIPQLLDVGKYGIREQLRERRKQGYIELPGGQFRGYNNLWCPRIYAISAKGEKLYHQYRPELPHKVTRLDTRKGDRPAKNFAHAMMVCDAMASIEIGLKDTGARLISYGEIISRLDPDDDPMRLEFNTHFRGETVRGKLVPDGLFGIEYPDGTASFFVLETEHFNPPGVQALEDPEKLKKAVRRTSGLKKLIAYKDIHDRKTYKQLGIPNFHVLVLAPNPTTAKTYRQMAEAVCGKCDFMLFGDIPVQEDLFKAPPPFPDLTTKKLMRAGMDDVQLFNSR